MSLSPPQSTSPLRCVDATMQCVSVNSAEITDRVPAGAMRISRPPRLVHDQRSVTQRRDARMHPPGAALKVRRHRSPPKGRLAEDELVEVPACGGGANGAPDVWVWGGKR